MKRLKTTDSKPVKSCNRRLVRIGKLGKPPSSSADIKSIIRSLVRENPIQLEALLKQAMGSSDGFNEQGLESAISQFTERQDDASFEDLFNVISDGLNQAIQKRRGRAEEIIRNQGYQVNPLGNRVFKVNDTEDGDVYQTDVGQETCTCIDFQRINGLGLWCKHLYGLYGMQNGMLDMD